MRNERLTFFNIFHLITCATAWLNVPYCFSRTRSDSAGKFLSYIRFFGQPKMTPKKKMPLRHYIMHRDAKKIMFEIRGGK